MTDFLPDCMTPDGGTACRGYQQTITRLRRIAEIIEAVDNRCMAVDGPVTTTLNEMRQREISEIYELAKGRLLITTVDASPIEAARLSVTTKVGDCEVTYRGQTPDDIRNLMMTYAPDFKK